MRVWTQHPKYLDRAGFIALWRETLLAKKVLEGNTKGYRNHPQLTRFKNTENPVRNVDVYLYHVFKESQSRGYSFSREKFVEICTPEKIDVKQGQLKYEWRHLLEKLKRRDINKYNELTKIHIDTIEPHPIFHVVDGDTPEEWEIIETTVNRSTKRAKTSHNANNNVIINEQVVETKTEAIINTKEIISKEDIEKYIKSDKIEEKDHSVIINYCGK